MKYKFLLLVFLGMFLINFVSADSISFQIRFIVPAEDTTPPTWSTLRNLSGYTNTAFSRYITATDDSGISCYSLNNTTTFNVDCSGQITNSVVLDTVTVYYLNISVNDTLGNMNWGEFYINITNAGGGGTTLTCRYKSFGYYDTDLPWYVEGGCI